MRVQILDRNGKSCLLYIALYVEHILEIRRKDNLLQPDVQPFLSSIALTVVMETQILLLLHYVSFQLATHSKF